MEINEIIIDAVKEVLRSDENRFLIDKAIEKGNGIQLTLSFTYGRFASAKLMVQEYKDSELWRIKNVI